MLIFYKNLACLYRHGVLVNIATIGIHDSSIFQVHLIKQTKKEEKRRRNYLTEFSQTLQDMYYSHPGPAAKSAGPSAK